MASQYGPATDDPKHNERNGFGGAYARTERAAANDASIGGLISSLLSDTNRLVKDEIRLAKAEAASKVDQARSGVVSIAIGAAAILLGAIYLIQSLIYALANVMPGWASALIVGGVIALAGLYFLKKGQSDLKAKNLAPSRTQENLSRDAHMIKESV